MKMKWRVRVCERGRERERGWREKEAGEVDETTVWRRVTQRSDALVHSPLLVACSPG